MIEEELQEMRQKLLRSRQKAERLAKELKKFEEKIDGLLEKRNDKAPP